MSSLLREVVIPAAEGRSLEINAGEYLSVIDLEGTQVADFVAIQRQAAAVRLGGTDALDAASVGPPGRRSLRQQLPSSAWEAGRRARGPEARRGGLGPTAGRAALRGAAGGDRAPPRPGPRRLASPSSSSRRRRCSLQGDLGRRRPSLARRGLVVRRVRRLLLRRVAITVLRRVAITGKDLDAHHPPGSTIA